jgi:hypothetical protein
MARKRKKSITTVHSPRLRITSKGVKLNKPSARIGGKAGVNVSSRGVSASLRTSAGTISTRQGITLNPISWLRRLFNRR